jgi:hypothetical protein
LNIYQKFLALPSAGSASDFEAIRLPGARYDFVAKAKDGAVVILLQDASPIGYSPRDLSDKNIQS